MATDKKTARLRRSRRSRAKMRELGVSRSTFYAWYRHYAEHGFPGLEPAKQASRRHWNRIPDQVREQVVQLALTDTELSPRELACRYTDR